MIRNPRGMLLFDKPVGITSFQALGACKRFFGTKKVGHAGTLDKFASGLLLVFVGEATRLVPWFVGLDKTYHATIRFGSETATLDPEGEVVREAAIPSEATIRSKLLPFVGPQLQVPPRYSAIHVEGKRAYERVLAGEEMELKPREVTISRLDMRGWQMPDLHVDLDCSSGTYVRSLARDLGLACGSAAHLVELRRNRVGEFEVANAVAGSITRELPLAEPGPASWLDGRRLGEAIPGIESLELDPGRLADFRNGKRLDVSWFTEAERGNHLSGNQDGEWVVLCGDTFPGIVCREGGDWSYRLVFPSMADS